ncbi:MAG: HAMP domain-containing histidine kinase [Fibrobacterales bacterium]
MYFFDQKIQNERNKLVNKIFIIASGIFVFVLIASLGRIPDIGWQPVMGVHLGLVVVVWGVTFFRNTVSLSLKITISFFLISLAGITGLFTFGIVSDVSMVFIFLVIIASAFNRVVLSWVFLGTAVALYYGLGYFVSTGAYTFSVDSGVYSKSLSTWVSSGTSLLIWGIIALLIIRTMNDMIYKHLLVVNQQKVELEKLNAAKNKVFAVIGHDMKRPFNSLLGLMQLFHNGKGSMSDERKGVLLEKIFNDTQNVYGLLDNLLIWARSELGEGQSNKGSVRVQRLVAHAVAPYLTIAEKKGVVIQRFLLDETVLFVDEPTIRIVLSNLINNAIKFTPYDGVIKISCHEVDKGVELRVADTGVGMEADYIEKLFDQEMHTTTRGTDNEKGVGIGLGICYDLVAKIEGSLSVTSEPGEGSVFSVLLPHSLDTKYWGRKYSGAL